MSEPVVQGAVLQEGQRRCFCRCMPSMHSSEVLLAAQIRLRAQGLSGYCKWKEVVVDCGSEIQDSVLKYFFKFVCLINYTGANGSSWLCVA